MATKQASTTRHLHTERSQWEYLPQPILTYLGVGGVGAKPADITGCVAMICKDQQSKAKQSRAKICNQMSAPADQVVTPPKRSKLTKIISVCQHFIACLKELRLKSKCLIRKKRWSLFCFKNTFFKRKLYTQSDSDDLDA